MKRRPKLARTLRKWADLIDPRTPPSEPMTIEVTVNSEQAEKKIAELTAACERLNDAMSRLGEQEAK